MNDKHRNWIATPTETMVAWIVATSMALLVVGAFLWPQIKSEKTDSTVSVQEQPEGESIEKIITKVQRSEKHQIKSPTEPTTPEEPAPVSKPAIKTISKADPAPAIKKPAPIITPKSAASPSMNKQTDALPSKLSAGYYVQTGAFSDRKHAEAQAKKLSANWKTQIKKKPNNLYAVWSGPYTNSKEATAAKNSIAMRTKIKGFIVKN